MTRRLIRVLDLFAGAGGLTAGFHQASARFKTVRAVEMDHAAAASYEQTFGEGTVFAGPIQEWLKAETVPNVDIIVGGPPCQGFSTLGKQDVEDSRNFLWEEYARSIVKARPKYFVVENVAAFARSAQFKDFSEAVEPDGILADYDFDHRILNAADFGSPQARKRAVIIGHHRDLAAPGFPRPTHLAKHVSVKTAFTGVPWDPDRQFEQLGKTVQFGGHEYAGAFTPRDLHFGRSYAPISISRFAAIPVGGNRFDLPENLKADCWKTHLTGSADVMGRLHWDRPSVTIRTEFFKPEKGRYLHPEAMRALTHFEAAVLQGFPESHRFVGSKAAIARQIGNAVPIPLGRAIGAHLAKLL